MSALGGLFNFDGSAVDWRFLGALGDGLDRSGPDGGMDYLCGPVGMVYRAFHTTSESRLERQPLLSCRGDMICWDGRVDNREDLISVLRDDLKGDHTDVAIVMACYLRWGVEFLPRIIGDFALCLWDPRERILLLARDAIGPRTLYYNENGNRIIWSTDLEALLGLAEIDLIINEEYIADAMTGLPGLGQTPYRSIHGVIPAHAVLVRNGRSDVSEFWRLDPEHKIRYRTEPQYEEHFRHLFREAVRCRMRADRPVWAELSGGLDSSSIVCTADDLIKNGETETFGFETVSRIFDEASGSDERKYIHYVEKKIGRRGVYIREDDCRFMSSAAEACSRTLPNMPADFVAAYFKAMEDLMQKRGARVLLSGECGDEMACAIRDPYPELADLFMQANLLGLHRRLRVWSEALKKPYLTLLWRQTVLKVLPRWFRNICDQKREVKAIKGIYDCSFFRRMKVDQRVFGHVTDAFGFDNHCGRYHADLFLRAVRSLSAGYYKEFTSVEIRYPYTHRPLIEFLVAMPFEQKVRPSETRSIVRRALSGSLPLEIVNRRGKGQTRDAYLRAAAREWERLDRLFTDPRVCVCGYANYQALRRLVETAREGNDLGCSALIRVKPVEHWLRALESRRQSLRVASRTQPTAPVQMDISQGSLG